MVEQVDIERVLTELKRVAATALNEEEFKINAERILYNEVISKLGLQPGRYEYTFISGGRLDALYGHLLIEYKAPGKLSKPSDIARAKEQLIGYIGKEAEVEERYRLFLGVILSDRIAFVRYDSKAEDWLMRGPYDLNRETVLRLIEAMRGLRRKRLAADELLQDFGPKSPITRNAVKVLYDKVTESRSSKVEALFNDWKRLFSQVCAYNPEKLKGLEAKYGIGGPVDYNALLFSIHTYCALIMKLLGAEIAYLYGAGKWLKSYVTELEDAHMRGLDALKRALEDLESGGVFRKLLNITNFIEGDYFSWYLEELDEELAGVIAEMTKRLADYEPATPVLEPEYTRDMLKRLYQNLVPKRIRHDLGEYYTPDWLADLVLNEVGITVENLEKLAQEKDDTLAPLNLRVLDPACGSGTFPILAMKTFREYAEKHYLREVLADHLLRNVVGFDLNPLAVLAARTNYLLALADLFPYVKGSIEIPIYLADSLLVETRTTLTGTTYVIRTYVGEFQMPKSIVEKGLLGRLLEAIDRYVRLRYRVEDFKQVVKGELNLDEGEQQLTGDLYRTFLKLEEEGKNHVWTSIIKNAFAPLTITSSIGKFDYVIGNPPWINWENLPSEYREATKPIWEKYGLEARATKKQFELGKMRRDISMVFTYLCTDRYLNDGGLFGFLITQMVFKTKGAEVFRRFILPNRTPLKVIKAHDMVTLKPFEGAANMTSMLILEKGKRTEYPIPYVRWVKLRQGDLTSATLEEACVLCSQQMLVAVPIDHQNPASQWLTGKLGTLDALNKISGRSSYKAFEGVHPAGANGVYWIKIREKTSQKTILVENLPRLGRKKIQKILEYIEIDLVYPLIRSGDLKKWSARHTYYMIIPHTKRTGWRAITDPMMKIKYPRTYNFFMNFKDVLIKRSAYKLLRKGHPFYIMIDIHSHSFASFKLTWKQIGNRIDAAVLSSVDDPYLGKKPLMPQWTLAFIPMNSKDQAHYLCSILNSACVDLLIKSFSQYGGKGFAPPSILEMINLPKFDVNNELHRKLSKLSRICHNLASEDKKDELVKVEDKIDRAVAKLYGLTDEDLKEVKKSLAILEGKEIEEEEVEEEPKEVNVDFLDAVVRPNVIGSFEVAVSNPLKEKVTVELQLPERPVKLETEKEEDKIRVKVPPLEMGEYKVPYKIITSEGVVEGDFTLYVKEEEKHRAREALASKLEKLLRE